MNMDISADEYIKKLEELIIDEDKIVTVPFLCTTFKISAKESKLLLDEFVTVNRKTHPGSLSLTYILSGVRDNNVPSISIVKEESLDDKKDLYIEEPIVEIYSVQKCKEIDFKNIGLIDYFNVHSPPETFVAGSVVSKNCTKRQLKVNPVPSTTVNNKPTFTKVAPKPKSIIENGSAQSTKSPNLKIGSSSKGASVAELFKKVEPKSNTNNKPTKIGAQKDVQSTLQKLVDTDDDDTVTSISESPSQSSAKKSKRTKKETHTKRRKRIVVEEESDDDIFASNGEEEEEVVRKRKNVLEDSEEDEAIKKSESSPVPKNKKRKLVDKTFEDEDGYIITRKEWVDMSGSENESEVVKARLTKVEESKEEAKKDDRKVDKPNSNANEKVVNNKGPTGKGKKAVPTNQPTLMNFFKMK